MKEIEVTLNRAGRELVWSFAQEVTGKVSLYEAACLASMVEKAYLEKFTHMVVPAVKARDGRTHRLALTDDMFDVEEVVKYAVIERETRKEIDVCGSEYAAIKLLHQYECEDREKGTFKSNFYEVIKVED